VCVAVLLAASGCGERTALNEPFFPVKGKISMADGKPLASGNVMFTANKSGLVSSAPIGADGTFELKGTRDGLPQGEYRVWIEPGAVSSVQAKKPSKRARSKISVPFPEKYLDEDVSPLKVTIKPESAGNELTLTLEK
jgi:hypothetical protein